jgi:hypothetical protein
MTTLSVLKQAVRTLGGPYRASRLYNEAFWHKPDPQNPEMIVRAKLARSTLETWLNGTDTERAQVVGQRLAALAADPQNRPSRRSYGKAKGKPKRKARGKRSKAAEAADAAHRPA